MNRPARALLGALIGALLALYAHPYSRTRLLAPLLFWGPAPELTNAPELLEHLDALPIPKTLADFSLWMQAGAKRIIDREPTGEKEWASLMAAAAQAATLDHGNAYWHQMRAVIAHAAKQDVAARSSWQTASNRTFWDDGQTARLKKLRRRLVDRYGPGAWTASAVYPYRSTAPARCIELFARDIARTTPLTDRESLSLRLATVRNGKLMRDGAKSMRVAEIGIGVVELASYPPNLSSINSPRKLLLARAELYGLIAAQISRSAADDVDRCFRDNDSWLSYPTSTEASNDAEELAILSAVANGLTAILLITALLGLVLQGLSRMLVGSPLQKTLAPPWVGLLGLAVAIVAYIQTKQPVLSIASAAGFGFMAFTPTKERTRPSYDLGLLHILLMFIVSCLIAVPMGLGLTSKLTLGEALIQGNGLPVEALGGTNPSVSGLILAMATLAVVSAFYGLARRLQPSAIFSNTLGRIGAGLAWSGMTLAVIAAPFLLWTDRQVDLMSTQKLENEAVYYFFES